MTQKKLAYGLGAGITALLALSILLYRSNQQKQQANRLLVKQKAVIGKREEEKALLLKELNHRVKNNLQMISSLLNLQSHELVSHPAVEAIQAGKYRVEAMSLIHQKLYREDHHTQIPMKTYIKELVGNLNYSFGRKAHILYNFEDFSIDVDRAIPLALIINELATNALKHAFVHQPTGQLEIHVHQDAHDQLVMVMADNGVGMNSWDVQEGSFGIKLIKSLAEQLDANIDTWQNEGTHWKLVLKSTTPCLT